MNNEAILNKLIELGYVMLTESGELYLDSNGSARRVKGFAPLLWSSDAELIQRALFAECAKRGIQIKIEGNTMELWWRNSALSYTKLTTQPDTSRESFVAAFCKVVGVSCE